MVIKVRVGLREDIIDHHASQSRQAGACNCDLLDAMHVFVQCLLDLRLVAFLASMEIQGAVRGNEDAHVQKLVSLLSLSLIRDCLRGRKEI